MQKEYTTLQIPENAECIRGENEIGVFNGRADSVIYLDKNTNTIYKHYQAQKPESIALYHTIHNNLASLEPSHRSENGKETIIGDNSIQTITAQFLPLEQKDIYSDGFRGTITTPVYIPGATLMDMIIDYPQVTRLVNTVCAQISGDVGRLLKLGHPNHYPNINPANIKYKIHNKKLYLLITDVGGSEFGVYDMIRNFEYPREQKKLNFQEVITPQTQAIIDLFLYSDEKIS